MTAYVVIRIEAQDPSKLKNYQKVAPSIIDKYNGKILARGGEMATLEGPEETRRIVIIEFQSLDNAKKFYGSEEYSNAIKLRNNIASFEIIAIDGIN